MPPRHPRAYDEIWRAAVPRAQRLSISRETGYRQRELVQAHVEIFFALPGMLEEDKQTQRQFFGEYLYAMVREGSSRERRDQFFRDVGIHPLDFDWQAWREVMGYGQRR